ncbi:MAG: hypothetical protein Q8M09_13135 [Pseudomonadota bacterium]|nr:hypothetical protein [Pseudomonadota bacterium]MDP1905171.1 hypothetical protein [Pseudomonadota bacterium]
MDAITSRQLKAEAEAAAPAQAIKYAAIFAELAAIQREEATRARATNAVIARIRAALQQAGSAK